MIRSLTLALALVPFVLVVAAPVVAQEEEHAAETHGTEAHATEAHDAGGHATHKNHISAFLGGATHLNNEDTALAFGGHYERLVTPRLGIGVVVEYATSDIERDRIVLGAAGFRITRALSLLGGVGAEFATREHEDHGHIEEEEETELLLRVGLGYSFPLAERWTLNPQVLADWTKHAWTLVYGLSLGYGF